MRDPFTRAIEVYGGQNLVTVNGWHLDAIYLGVADGFTDSAAAAVLSPDEARDLISALESAIREVEA